jgi:anti-sigma factor RsiW
MHSEWTDQLSGYLDDELAPGPRADLDRHLAQCAECARTLAELRAVASWARAYRGAEPARDLWPGVRERIDRDKGAAIGRMAGVGWRQLIAAGIAVVAIGGGALWLGTRGPVVAPPLEPPFVANPASVGTADLAVRDLEDVLDAARAELDTSTVRVIEESLVLIDQAIAEARAAIQRDQSNQYLKGRIGAGNLRGIAWWDRNSDYRG